MGGRKNVRNTSHQRNASDDEIIEVKNEASFNEELDHLSPGNVVNTASSLFIQEKSFDHRYPDTENSSRFSIEQTNRISDAKHFICGSILMELETEILKLRCQCCKHDFEMFEYQNFINHIKESRSKYTNLDSTYETQHTEESNTEVYAEESYEIKTVRENSINELEPSYGEQSDEEYEPSQKKQKQSNEECNEEQSDKESQPSQKKQKQSNEENKKRYSKLKRPQNNKEILKYFEIDARDGPSKCKKCSTVLKGKRASTLKAHLTKVHKIKFNENCPTLVRSKTPPPLKIKIEVSKKKILRAYIGLVTEDGIPLNVLSSRNFRNLLDPLSDGLKKATGKSFKLNVETCKKTLNHITKMIRDHIERELKDQLISLKIDYAFKINPNIFGFSAQYVKDNQIYTRILSISEMKGHRSSISHNLAEEISSCLSKYNMNLRRIVSVTCDIGANKLKPTKTLLNQENLIVADEEEDDQSFLQDIEIFEKEEVALLGGIKICRCAANAAQLCALDLIKDNLIKKDWLKCRSLTKYIKSSKSHRQLLEIKSCKVPNLDCVTRWGSTYNMIADLAKAREFLQNITVVESAEKNKVLKIDDELWNFVTSYVLVLEPLQKAIIRFQKENLHYGNFYAQWLKCKILTEKLIKTNEQNTIVRKIGKCILQSIDNRMKAFYKNDGFNACLFLDPRFHHTLTADRKIEARGYLKCLWSKVKALNRNESKISEVATIQPPENFSDEEDKMLNDFLCLNAQCASENNDDVHYKIDALQLPFTRVDVDILKFWAERKERDPEMYALSEACFSIPTTQVAEPVFSSFKWILTDSSNYDALENILLAKLYPSFTDKAIETRSFENE